MTNTPEFKVWSGMRRRCSDPTDVNYHGRGISVCERWQNNFQAFYDDMGPRPSPDHSIGRRDNDGNYEPSNCRWETPFEQMANTRHNRRVEWRGETMIVAEFARRVGYDKRTVFNRLNTGWTLEQIAAGIPPPRPRKLPSNAVLVELDGVPVPCADAMRILAVKHATRFRRLIAQGVDARAAAEACAVPGKPGPKPRQHTAVVTRAHRIR